MNSTPSTPPMKPLTAAAPPPLPVRKSQQRSCACCTKRLALSDFPCGKCNFRHCATHRLPEQHDCIHDFREAGKHQLTEQLVKITADKVDRI